MTMPRVTAEHNIESNPVFANPRPPEIELKVEFDLNDSANALRLLEVTVKKVREQIYKTDLHQPPFQRQNGATA